jgi:hypothetical protein
VGVAVTAAAVEPVVGRSGLSAGLVPAPAELSADRRSVLRVRLARRTEFLELRRECRAGWRETRSSYAY